MMRWLALALRALVVALVGCRARHPEDQVIRATLPDGRQGFTCLSCHAVWPVLERDRPALRPEVERAHAEALALLAAEAVDRERDRILEATLRDLREQVERPRKVVAMGGTRWKS